MVKNKNKINASSIMTCDIELFPKNDIDNTKTYALISMNSIELK